MSGLNKYCTDVTASLIKAEKYWMGLDPVFKQCLWQQQVPLVLTQAQTHEIINWSCKSINSMAQVNRKRKYVGWMNTSCKPVRQAWKGPVGCLGQKLTLRFCKVGINTSLLQQYFQALKEALPADWLALRYWGHYSIRECHGT